MKYHIKYIMNTPQFDNLKIWHGNLTKPTVTSSYGSHFLILFSLFSFLALVSISHPDFRKFMPCWFADKLHWGAESREVSGMFELLKQALVLDQRGIFQLFIVSWKYQRADIDGRCQSDGKQNHARIKCFQLWKKCCPKTALLNRSTNHMFAQAKTLIPL